MYHDMILRLLIKEILTEEDRGQVTVTQGSSSGSSSSSSSSGDSWWSRLFSADESGEDEEIIDERDWIEYDETGRR